MKKVLFLVLIGFSLSSCKKDYVCECVLVYDIGIGFNNYTTQTSTSHYNIENVTKNDAESKCAKLNSIVYSDTPNICKIN